MKKRKLKRRKQTTAACFSLCALLFGIPERTFGQEKLSIAKTEAAIAQSGKDMQALEQGKAIEGELAGGQSHSYQIKLAAGQFLDVVIEQRGIDVVVTLYAPDGKELIEVDSPNGTQGPEPLNLITEASGIYRLEVRSLEKNAAGRYEARIEALRTATAQDRKRIADAADLKEANRLGLQVFKVVNEASTNAGTMPQVLREKRFREAIPVAERVVAIRERVLGAEHTEVATALIFLAALYSNISDYQHAEPVYLRALAIYEKSLAPDDPNIIAVNNIVAGMYRDKGDYTRAEQFAQRELSLSEKKYGAEKVELVSPLIALGLIYKTKGDYERAEQSYRHALEIGEKAFGKDDPRILDSLDFLATIYGLRNDYERAIHPTLRCSPERKVR